MEPTKPNQNTPDLQPQSTSPRFLYHGTSESRAVGILEHGLTPRSQNGHKNWSNESHDWLVYLSECYAPYFGANASKDGERLAVIEVDVSKLDQQRLLPDEDFLEQASRFQKDLFEVEGISMEERTRYFRDNIEIFAHHWEDSLCGLGNCAYAGPIGIEAISRVALFDHSKNQASKWIFLALCDPTISLMNYRLCAEKYRAINRWVMGYKDFDCGQMAGPVSSAFQQDMVEEMNQMLSDQSSVDVIYERSRQKGHD
ncbi:MAG: hypothetical protein V3W44_06185 [Dehalococcoidales bacterium]